MSTVNPLDVIRKAQAMPESLQEELANPDNNTSLDTSQATDGRKPLLDAYIDNRLRSDKPITFLSFVDDLDRLWKKAGKPGKFIRNMPLNDDAVFPSITYRIKHREINKDFKDLKPRYRQTILHPDIEGEYIELYGQMFDVLVEFSIFSKSAEQADEIVIELEEFLQTYAGFFKKNGVQEILFDHQGEDSILEEARLGVAQRTLLYKMRFEKIIVRFQNEIEQIAVQANLRKEGEIN